MADMEESENVLYDATSPTKNIATQTLAHDPFHNFENDSPICA